MHVVYKIDCVNCNASYVRQTKRNFKTRIQEHRSNIKSTVYDLSVISKHKLEHNHEFDWDRVEILY